MKINKQDLKNYVRYKIELARLENKIEEVRNRLEKPRANILSDMPRGGERKDFTDDIDMLIELQEVYNKWCKKIIAEQIRIETAILELADPIERAVMEWYTSATIRVILRFRRSRA